MAQMEKTSLKWLTVPMPLLEISKRLWRDQRERQERDYRDGAMADGLTYVGYLEIGR